jgi:predicted AAA+ superfamily ATPase
MTSEAPAEILNRRNAEVAKIRSFADLTEEAKDRRIAEVNERANAQYAEAKEAEKQRREERLKSIQRSVFNVVDDVITPPAERA